MNILVKIRGYIPRPSYQISRRGEVYESGADEGAFRDSQRNGQVGSILFVNAASIAESIAAVELVTGALPNDCFSNVICVDDETGKMPDTFEDVKFDLATGNMVDNRQAKRELRPATIGRTPLSQRLSPSAKH